MSDFSAFDNALRSLESIPLARVAGRLVRLNGILLESVGCPLMTGQLCRIESANHTLIDAQAVGFNRDITYLMPFKQPVGLMAGARVFPEEKAHDILIGESWLGRVVNGLGEPLDGKGRLNGNDLLPPLPPSVNPLTRRSVDEPLDVGVKAINGLLTIGKGQRVGLMAGSGVGKSVLLGMITRQTKADIVVVGLIGERGREVKEFIDHSLGADGLAKSIVVVAPADESPLMRLKATELCHSIAAWFLRPRASRLTAGGFPDPLRDGSAGNCSLARRTTRHQRLSAIGIRHDPQTGRERRQQRKRGIDDRYLHRAGGRRRPARSDCRLRPCGAGRAYRINPQAGGSGALSGH